MSSYKLHRAAFSLVELSIVLVILGLLTGGVLSGQSLIRASELRAIPIQLAEIQSSVMTFKEKYFALPGDMTNATSFWGTMSTGACPNASGTGTQTCNGNGNGSIDWVAGDNVEPFLFWQHIANSQLINGIFNGRWGGAFSTSNSLTSKLPNTFWYSQDYGTQSIADIDDFDGQYNNTIVLFGLNTLFLTPSEMWGIDKKIDDSKPATGKVLSKESDGVGCNSVAASNAVSLASTAAYNLSNDTLACSNIFFTNQW